jgi:hypothetical protein
MKLDPAESLKRWITCKKVLLNRLLRVFDGRNNIFSAFTYIHTYFPQVSTSDYITVECMQTFTLGLCLVEKIQKDIFMYMQMTELKIKKPF